MKFLKETKISVWNILFCQKAKNYKKVNYQNYTQLPKLKLISDFWYRKKISEWIRRKEREREKKKVIDFMSSAK